MSPKVRTRIAIALVLSLAFHACAGLFFNLYRPPKPPPPVTIVFGRISLEHRQKPPPPPRSKAARPVPEKRVAVRPEHAPAAAARVEEARITRKALAYQPPRTRSRAPSQGVLPQVDFQKTIAKLRAENNPVAAAQEPVDAGAHTKNFSADFSASIGGESSGDGYLEPIQSWHDGGYDYYRVHYEVQYPDGTTEEGIVPWPIRYPPQIDPFRLGVHRMPLPVPLPDFQLPPGTVLHPLVAYCFEHRAELSSCPIAHD